MIAWLTQIFCHLVYGSYLFFQLFSHKGLYQDDNEEIVESKRYAVNPFKIKKLRRGKQPATPQYAETPLVISPPSSPQPRFLTPEDRPAHGAKPTSDPESGHVVAPMLLEDETEEPQMSVPVSVGLLAVVTVVSLLVICAPNHKGER